MISTCGTEIAAAVQAMLEQGEASFAEMRLESGPTLTEDDELLGYVEHLTGAWMGPDGLTIEGRDDRGLWGCATLLMGEAVQVLRGEREIALVVNDDVVIGISPRGEDPAVLALGLLGRK